jgi:hypothetical protein
LPCRALCHAGCGPAASIRRLPRGSTGPTKGKSPEDRPAQPKSRKPSQALRPAFTRPTPPVCYNIWRIPPTPRVSAGHPSGGRKLPRSDRGEGPRGVVAWSERRGGRPRPDRPGAGSTARGRPAGPAGDSEGVRERSREQALPTGPHLPPHLPECWWVSPWAQESFLGHGGPSARPFATGRPGFGPAARDPSGTRPRCHSQ